MRPYDSFELLEGEVHARQPITHLPFPSVQRDQEDYNLEQVNLDVTNIEEFDVVFSRIKTLLNRLVELNNDVNGSMGELKTAYARATRSFELNVSMGPSTDTLILDLSSRPEASTKKGQSKRGARPSPSDVLDLLSDPSIMQSDMELEHSRLALLAALEARSDSVSLAIDRDDPSGGSITLSTHNRIPEQPAELVRFNSALSQLRELLLSRGLYVIAQIKPSPAFSALALKVNLAKASRGLGDGFDGSDTTPATLLDVCSSSMASTIKDSEDYLIDRVHQLAQCTRGFHLQWQVLYGHRLELESFDAIRHEATKGQVTKLLLAVNVALFRLLNAGASARSPASLVNAVSEIARPLFTSLKQKLGDQLSAQDLKVRISSSI